MRSDGFDTGNPLPRDHFPRKAGRVSLEAEVTFKKVGGLSYLVQVLDASPHGCKIEFVEKPRLSDQMIITFDGLEPLSAIVCWVDGFSGGIEFDRPLHPAVFEHLRRKPLTRCSRS